MAKPRIAIIGSGISGLGAAFALKDTANIEVWEARDRLGGHSNTVDITYDGEPLSVDTGFIVFNTLKYPNLLGLFAALNVEEAKTNMSFGFSDDGVEWGSEAGGVFAQKRNLLRPSFLNMLRNIVRFNAQARRDLEADSIGEASLDQYLKRHRFGTAFRDRYLLPMGAAIWSTSQDGMGAQPAATVLKFFDNHRLLQIRRPADSPWRTVAGGSREYVNKIAALLTDRIKLNTPVERAHRDAGGVWLQPRNGAPERFDHVIFACHSDQTLNLLADPSDDERAYLSAIRYAPNEAILHRDASVMPRAAKAWAAWNYRHAEDTETVEVSYHMNRLQRWLPADKPVFVTLNPSTPIDPELTFARFRYDHPQFDRPAVAAQRVFNRIQGVQRTWFAGAWLGYGFHEDGLRSGLRVALKLGGQIPWEFADGDVDGGPWAVPGPNDEAGAGQMALVR